MLELKNYEILCGDALERLKDIPDNTVQTCITSPPYYGLRDYGTGKWIGGDPNCKHYSGTYGKNVSVGTHKKMKDSGMPTVGFAHIMRNVCTKCGAIREDKQIGLEETPEQYINKLVEVFREVKRVLKDDGTLWVNIGDSYANANPNNRNFNYSGGRGGNNPSITSHKFSPTYKQKDLIGIPWMLAFALRADGWYLRQDIIWHKPNPMPESVEDRCTKSHEYIFLLSKKPNYYFDHDAIQEEASTSEGRLPGVVRDRVFEYNSKRNNNPEAFLLGANDRKPHASDYKYLADDPVCKVRNKRDVWSINTSPYKGAHFATFPEKLIEPCILAGSKEGDVVLDPFNGSGTTGAVSLKHKRKYIGVELNPEYIKLTEDRFDSITYVEKHVDKVTGEVTKIQMVDLF